MIRTKPPSNDYRAGWDRVFALPEWSVGDRATWHYPLSGLRPSYRLLNCTCDRHGTVESVRTLSNGRVHVDRLVCDDGSVVDPTISPDELTKVGAPCPWERG